jgi:hypothetical protein
MRSASSGTRPGPAHCSHSGLRGATIGVVPRGAPPGYEPLETDVPWDASYLELVPPERVLQLDELGDEAAGPTALSPLAITTPFKLLSDEGLRVLQAICAELETSAWGNERIAKRVRGAVYRSDFLRGLSTDPTLLEFLSDLAQVRLEPHPVSHHAIHINYAPDDLDRNVDQWHRDAISFDYVLMVNDPRPMKGGRFEYFLGSVEEGRKLIESGQGLPPDRVASPDFPGPGWAVFQQGHRVLHRAGRLLERYPRITIVGSFWTPNPEIPDPTDLPTLRKADGREIAMVEWSRYVALATARRLEYFAETKTDFARPLEEVRAALEASIADVESAIAEFDSEDEGRMISFEPPSEGTRETVSPRNA